MINRRVLKSRVCEQFLVTTKSGQAFAGVLWEIDDRALVLRNTQAVGAGENGIDLPLDGELVVLLSEVSYMQRT